MLSPPPNPLPQLAAWLPRQRRRPQREATAEYAPDGPGWRGSGEGPLAGRRPLRTPLAAAGSRDRRLGPERGAPPPLAPALSASVPSPSREAPDGAAGTRRRLAAGMVLSGGQSPGARRSRRPRPAGPPLPAPRPGLPAPAPRAFGPAACLCLEPRDGSHSPPLLPRPLPEPFASSGGSRPSLRLPGARAGGGTWAPGRGGGARLPVAGAAAAGREGGGRARRPGLTVPAAASAPRCCCCSCCCCCRRGRCLRRGGGRRRRGFSCPVTLRSHDRESGATSAKRLRAAPAGGERRRESSGGKSPSAPPAAPLPPRPPPPPAALPPPPPPPPPAARRCGSHPDSARGSSQSSASHVQPRRGNFSAAVGPEAGGPTPLFTECLGRTSPADADGHFGVQNEMHARPPVKRCLTSLWSCRSPRAAPC